MGKKEHQKRQLFQRKIKFELRHGYTASQVSNENERNPPLLRHRNIIDCEM